MKILVSSLLLAGLAAMPSVASAGGSLPYPPFAEQANGISVGGRAPWSQPWQYDSDSGNDRRPELPYYQQGGGQLTGGPARNLLPDDGLHLFPR